MRESDHIVTTTNGRILLKVKCASFGITKTRFVSASSSANPADGGLASRAEGQGQAGNDCCIGKNSSFKSVPMLGTIL